MNAKEYVEFIKENSYIAAGSDAHRCMHLLARNARKITYNNINDLKKNERCYLRDTCQTAQNKLKSLYRLFQCD